MTAGTLPTGTTTLDSGAETRPNEPSSDARVVAISPTADYLVSTNQDGDRMSLWWWPQRAEETEEAEKRERRHSMSAADHGDSNVWG